MTVGTRIELTVAVTPAADAMSLSPVRWKRYAESRFAHEREALEYLRDGLPDSDPCILYSSFEFIGDDGSVIDPMADVFSLGAISFHIFSGRPPAANAAELNQVLTEQKGLPLAAALDGATPRLQEFIREATCPALLLRTETAADFLAGLDAVEEELTGPPQEALANPLDAKPAELLPFGLKVSKRLGGGSSAIALLVERDQEILLLKVAPRVEDNSRVEAETLKSLPNLVPLRAVSRECKQFLIRAGGTQILLVLNERPKRKYWLVRSERMISCRRH